MSQGLVFAYACLRHVKLFFVITVIIFFTNVLLLLLL